MKAASCLLSWGKILHGRQLSSVYLKWQISFMWNFLEQSRSIYNICCFMLQLFCFSLVLQIRYTHSHSGLKNTLFLIRNSREIRRNSLSRELPKWRGTIHYIQLKTNIYIFFSTSGWTTVLHPKCFPKLNCQDWRILAENFKCFFLC